MTDTLLTDVLRDWADEVAVPHDLADRALGRRRSRRRTLPVLAGLATAAVVVVAVALSGSVGPGEGRHPVTPAGRLDVHADTAHNPPEEVVSAGGLAVSAVVRADLVPAGDGSWETLRRTYAVADPATGRYRPTDWSYVAVAPGLKTAAVLDGPLPTSRIGIVDLVTGDEDWVVADHQVAALSWSPDGSSVVATAYDGNPDLQKSTGGGGLRTSEAKRTGFVLVDVTARTTTFHPLPASFFGGRADVGFTLDGDGLWSPSGGPSEQFFDLEGTPVERDRDAYNSNLSIDAAQLPLTSPDGRFTITQDSGLPTAITDNRTGEVHRQQALQVLGWADDEHVITLAGCSAPCPGTAEFRNGLVLMRYDGTDPVPLTGTRTGAGDWGFELTRR